MVSIFITDDHPLVLEGLKNVLSEADGLQVSGCFANAAATLEAIGSDPPAVPCDVGRIDLAFGIQHPCIA